MERNVDRGCAAVRGDRGGIARRVRDRANAERDVAGLEPAEGVRTVGLREDELSSPQNFDARPADRPAGLGVADASA
jgi:hypothetical protein